MACYLANMNRIKKILAALSELGIDPPAQAIRDAWAIVSTINQNVGPDERRAKALIDKVIVAVAGIADDLSKKDKQ